MSNEEFKKFKISANKAKTKYDMCAHMDRLNWRYIPWVHCVLDASDKASIRAEYEVFLSYLNSLDNLD